MSTKQPNQDSELSLQIQAVRLADIFRHTRTVLVSFTCQATSGHFFTERTRANIHALGRSPLLQTPSICARYSGMKKNEIS